MRHQYPAIVHSFGAFEGDNPFDPIMLMGAISNASNYDPEKHGPLFTIICYVTSYHNRDGRGLLLCIALANFMYVNTILGMTVINEW